MEHIKPVPCLDFEEQASKTEPCKVLSVYVMCYWDTWVGEILFGTWVLPADPNSP